MQIRTQYIWGGAQASAFLMGSPGIPVLKQVRNVNSCLCIQELI